MKICLFVALTATLPLLAAVGCAKAPTERLATADPPAAAADVNLRTYELDNQSSHPIRLLNARPCNAVDESWVYITTQEGERKALLQAGAAACVMVPNFVRTIDLVEFYDLRREPKLRATVVGTGRLDMHAIRPGAVIEVSDQPSAPPPADDTAVAEAPSE